MWTFERYFQEYEKRWNIDSRRRPQLHEYQDRTLYTTWDLSYHRLKEECWVAAKMLKLLAYFDNQSLWYELFKAGTRDGLPRWLLNVAQDCDEFESVMRILIDYCFIELHTTTQTYSVHTCVHDWSMSRLNTEVEAELFWYAFDCVAKSIEVEDWGHIAKARLALFVPHAMSLMHTKFCATLNGIDRELIPGFVEIAILLFDQDQLVTAEMMLRKALFWNEREWGWDNAWTLHTVHQLGMLYDNQGKLEQAEEMYERALIGYGKTRNSDVAWTVPAINKPDTLNCKQGKLEQAEEMFEKALAASSPGYAPILDVFTSLGSLYVKQGKLEQAEEMFIRALTSYGEVLEPKASSTLLTAYNLAELYRQQARLDQAKNLCERAVAGSERALGPNHMLTLFMVSSLGVIFYRQGKLDQAEVLCERALAGFVEGLGMKNMATLRTVKTLVQSYCEQGKFEKAEIKLSQVLPDFLRDDSDLLDSKLMLCTFVEPLALRVKVVPEDSEAARGRLAHLIQYVDSHVGEHMYWLARALLWIKDEENIPIAFSKAEADCSGCANPLDCTKGHYVCRQCIETDLCDECMSRHANQELVQPKCSRHDFFNAGSAVREILKSPESQNLSDNGNWMRRLKEKYPVSTAY